ncbi:MAG: DUF3109 family protein [Bacteroidaceae bacterium]|nr:DUF3109 family protein [Bacteroidaceae bacterium]
MFQVGDVIVSGDIITEKFCCDLDACKGQCCIDGDAGAPVSLDEVEKLEECMEAAWDDMSQQAQEVVAEQGVVYTDRDGDLVTSIVDNRNCVFTYYDDKGCCLCALEKAFREGRTKWCKPASCYLYPIRVAKVGGLDALNYHRWSVCKAAVRKGEELNLPVYKFLRGPLIAAYGEEWYAELEEVAAQLLSQNML